MVKSKTKVLIYRCFISAKFAGSIKILNKCTKDAGSREKEPYVQFQGNCREIMVSKQKVLLKEELMKLRFLWICVSCLIYFVSEFYYSCC